MLRRTRSGAKAMVNQPKYRTNVVTSKTRKKEKYLKQKIEECMNNDY